MPRPIHGPHPDGNGTAPAWSNAPHAPDASAASCTSLLAAAMYSSTPGATARPRATRAAASRSSSRLFTQDTR